MNNKNRFFIHIVLITINYDDHTYIYHMYIFRWVQVGIMTSNEYNGILFDQGLNQTTAAEIIGTKAPYVSMFITGRGNLPRKDWDKIYNYFMELRIAA